MAKLNVTLSGELDDKLNEIAELDSTTKSEILRKSLQLYLAGREGSKKGMKLYLIDPDDQSNKTEIIGLWVSSTCSIDAKIIVMKILLRALTASVACIWDDISK